MTLAEEQYEYWRQRCEMTERKYEKSLALLVRLRDAWEASGTSEDFENDVWAIVEDIRRMLER